MRFLDVLEQLDSRFGNNNKYLPDVLIDQRKACQGDQDGANPMVLYQVLNWAGDIREHQKLKICGKDLLFNYTRILLSLRIFLKK